MYDLKKVIEANTKEGVIDYEKVMGAIDNDYVNPIVAKKTDESKLLPKAVSQVISELGINGESIDDVKLYIKQMGGNTDEIKEENLQLTKKLKEIENQYNETVEAKSKLENDFKEKQQTDMLVKKLGIDTSTKEGQKQLEFYKWDFNKQVDDETTFENVVEKYVKENDIKTTTKFIKDDFGSGGGKELDISASFSKKRAFTHTK
jgi:hypothetical protein